MTQISNPLTGKSYPVTGISVSPMAEPDISGKKHRPLITYSTVFGGLFVIAFVVANDYGLGRTPPVATDRERMLVVEASEVEFSQNYQDGEKKARTHRVSPGSKRTKKKLERSTIATEPSKNVEELSVGILENTFCRGARRSSFCD